MMNTLTKNKIEGNLNHFHTYTGVRRESLPLKERMLLEEQAKIIKLSKKMVLYHEGEVPKGVYILLSGKIKFLQLNFDGTIQILFIYSEGDMFGHGTVLSNDKYSVTAMALEDCEILYIEKDHFLTILKDSPRLSNLFLQSISQEFAVLLNRITIFAQRSIKERLAFFLLILNEKYKSPGQLYDETEIKVNRSDLASYIGTSLENLVRTLKDFRDKNYIRTDRKSIYINNFEALYSLTGV
jgi:CRP-like cAMP-binding protein